MSSFKKQVIAFLLCWLWLTPAFAVISSSPIQQVAGSTGTNTLTITIAASATGNTLIYAQGGASATPTVSSIVTTNVTWARAVQSITNLDVEIWYGVVAGGSSGTTVTVNLGTTGVNVRGTVSEWSGVSISSQVDVSNVNNGTSVNPATGTITPTAGLNELFIAASRQPNTFTTGPTNGWTAGTTSNAMFQWAYKVVSSTSGTDSTDWTYNTSAAWDAAYATFKGGSGGNPVARKTLTGVGQ